MVQPNKSEIKKMLLKNKNILLLLLATVFVLFCPPAEAATIHVDDDYSSPVNYSCDDRTGAADDPYCKIQDAIDVAQHGDTVLVHSGNYAENIVFPAKAITVQAENGPKVTIIDGSHPAEASQGSGVTFAPGGDSDSILSGFTITGGSGTKVLEDFYGGGIYCQGSSPVIANCIITGNTLATYFSDGGGIYSDNDSSPTIINCTITGNSAGDYGGGISCGGSSTITNCTIAGNSADYGAGISCDVGSSPEIINCVITGNKARSNGGGIYCEKSSLTTITNCTLSGNLADYGGAIYCFLDSSVTLLNSILWGNSANKSGDEILLDDSSSSLTMSYSNIPLSSIIGLGNKLFENIINSAPLFVDPHSAIEAPTLAGDYHLQSASPCIDAGTSTGAPNSDIEETSRPQDGDGLGAGSTGDGSDYDIGAYEFDRNACTPGTIQSCDTGFSGVCATGTQTCSEDGEWGACIQNQQPSEEVCDEIDNDCDGDVDEGLKNTYYYDGDADGYGDYQNSLQACSAPQGYVSDNTDCDDAVAEVNPGVIEICDEADNDCDGWFDEGCSQPIFDVTIDLDAEPISICFIPDQPLPVNPMVSREIGTGTVQHGTEEIPTTKQELEVFPSYDGSCEEQPLYCVDYTPSQEDNEIKIKITEGDPPIITGDPGTQIASFMADPFYNRLDYFCLDNDIGGVFGVCSTTEEIILEFDAGALANIDGTPWIADPCTMVRVDELDQPPGNNFPDRIVTAPIDINLPQGITLANGRYVTISQKINWPSGWSGYELLNSMTIYYCDNPDDPTPEWKNDGTHPISIQLDKDSSSTGTLTYATSHLSVFAASFKQDSQQTSPDDNGTQSQGGGGGGGGCTIIKDGYQISESSALANTLILFLPLILIGIRWLRKVEVSKSMQNGDREV